MLQAVFEQATETSIDATGRNDGVAFLKATASLYDLLAIDYLSLDLPVIRKSETILRHSLHGIGEIRQKISSTVADSGRISNMGLLADCAVDWRLSPNLEGALEDVAAAADYPTTEVNALTIQIATVRGETALFGIVAAKCGAAWENIKSFAERDLRILMTYYHSHMLRLSGASVETDMIVSARELDCLKWTAAGKTAWEASRILGISERTVRFHLNSAREKLNCANTTQAVAKAVAENWISI
ncbi:MAG: response regulator transcription factor [Hyphomicrobiaceae bacterium]